MWRFYYTSENMILYNRDICNDLYFILSVFLNKHLIHLKTKKSFPHSFKIILDLLLQRLKSSKYKDKDI